MLKGIPGGITENKCIKENVVCFLKEHKPNQFNCVLYIFQALKDNSDRTDSLQYRTQ